MVYSRDPTFQLLFLIVMLASPGFSAATAHDRCGGKSAAEELELLRARFSSEDRRECLESLIGRWADDPQARVTLAEARRLLSRYTRRGPAFAVFTQVDLRTLGQDTGAVMGGFVLGLGCPIRKPGNSRNISLLVHWGFEGGGKANGSYTTPFGVLAGLGGVLTRNDPLGNRVGARIGLQVSLNAPYISMESNPHFWLEYALQIGFVLHDRRDFLLSVGPQIAVAPWFNAVSPGLVVLVGGMEFLP